MTAETDTKARLAGAKGADGEYIFGASVRVPCPCLAQYDGINHYLEATDGFRCCRRWLYDIEKESPNCHCCQGRRWTAATDGWEEAAVAAGAEVFRTWYDRSTAIWWADVRFPKCRGFVVQEDSPERARQNALHGAVEQIQGVQL